MPPGVAADLPQRTFTAPIHARCALSSNDAIAAQPQRSRLKLTVHPDALVKQPRGWLTMWTEKAESEGCIAPGQARALAVRIVESIALPSGADLRLLRVDGSPEYVEVGAGNGLQVVSPILRPGASPQALEYEIGKVSESPGGLVVDLTSSPPDLIGFETAWYDLRPKTAGDGFTIVSSSTTATMNGIVESRNAPAKNYFQFAPEMGYFRLFYKADQSEVLVAARNARSAPRRNGNLRPSGSGRTRLPGDSERRRSESLSDGECEWEQRRGGNRFKPAQPAPQHEDERRRDSPQAGNHQIVGRQTCRAGVRPLADRMY